MQRSSHRILYLLSCLSPNHAQSTLGKSNMQIISKWITVSILFRTQISFSGWQQQQQLLNSIISQNFYSHFFSFSWAFAFDCILFIMMMMNVYRKSVRLQRRIRLQFQETATHLLMGWTGTTHTHTHYRIATQKLHHENNFFRDMPMTFFF